MCIACEMNFWMALDEPPPVEPPVSADDFMCDAPEEPVPEPPAKPASASGE